MRQPPTAAVPAGPAGTCLGPRLPPRMLRAWRRTLYLLAGQITVRIGRRSPAADALLAALGARQGVIVTAWNPFGRRRPEGWNRRAGARLRWAARRIATVPAEGRLGTWVEEGLLLVGDPRPALRLARCFRQGGVVHLRRAAPARLLLLGGTPAEWRMPASQPSAGRAEVVVRRSAAFYSSL